MSMPDMTPEEAYMMIAEHGCLNLHKILKAVWSHGYMAGCLDMQDQA